VLLAIYGSMQSAKHLFVAVADLRAVWELERAAERAVLL